MDSSVASVCSALKVPYLTTHPVLASAENIQARKFAVHLGPSQNDLIQAVKDTIERLKWSEMALLSHRETGKLTFSHFKKKGEEKTFYELNDHFLILKTHPERFTTFEYLRSFVSCCSILFCSAVPVRVLHTHGDGIENKVEGKTFEQF